MPRSGPPFLPCSLDREHRARQRERLVCDARRLGSCGRPGRKAGSPGYRANVLTVARQLHFSAKRPERSPSTWRCSSTACRWRRWSSRTRTPGRAPTTPSRSTEARDVRTTCSSPSGPWCTSLSTPTGRSSRPGCRARTRSSCRSTSAPTARVTAVAPATRPRRSGSYAVAYLWEQIWQRDNWLEILQRFVHVETPEKTGVKTNPHTSARIFPRLPPVARGAEADRRTPRARRRAQLPRPALGGLGQVEHDRLAGAPAVQPVRRRTTSRCSTRPS